MVSLKITSKFLKVECPGCGKDQLVFNKPAIRVKCNSCGKPLAEPTGGKGRILGKIKQVI